LLLATARIEWSVADRRKSTVDEIFRSDESGSPGALGVYRDGKIVYAKDWARNFEENSA